MNRLMRLTARVLFSTGALSLGGLALTPSARAGEPACVAGATSLSAGQVRLEAIKAELALLGDPATYALPLRVVAQGGAVELHGVVPNESVHRKAVEVARRSCYLPIEDRVRVPGQPREASSPLGHAAHERLVRQLGAQADEVKVSAGPDGRLTLTGSVRTVEDKLQASRCLRSLPGCAALLNQLQVKSPAAPGAFTLVARPMPKGGEEAAEEPNAPAPLAMPGADEAEEVYPTLADSAATATAPGEATLPSGLPSPRQGNARVGAVDPGKEQFHSAVPAVPGGSGPASSGVASGVQAQRRSIWDRLRERPRGAAAAPAVIVASPGSSAAPADVQPAAQGTTRVQGLTPTAEPPVSPPPAPPTARTAPPVFQSRPLALLTRTQPAPRSSAPVPPVPRAAPAHDPAVKTTPEARPAAVETASAVVATQPAVKATSEPLGPPPPAADLVRTVRAACGKLARNVRAETGADGVLALHVYATPGNEQLLTAKLFGVPELGLTSVRLHVHIAP